MSDLAGRLAALLQADEVTLRALTTGTSRQTFEVTVAGPEPRRLILQQRLAGDQRAHLPADHEATLLRAAGRVGVPVPGVVAASADPAVIGCPFVLTEAVGGETIPRRILRDPELASARDGLAHQLGAAIGRLQAIPVDDLPPLEGGDALADLRADADELGLARPAMELAFAWLTEHRPPPRPPVLVHGDLRLGNLLVDEGGVAAILDWELAHLGDPSEDLGWLCVPSWRFGQDLPVGGVGTYEQLLAGYASARPDDVPDLATLHWWVVLGSLRWGIICARQAHTFLAGEVTSHELAAIGRRIVETERDVLVLTGAWRDEIRPPSEEAPPFDVPSATDLLTALDGWIADLELPAGAAYGARVARTIVATVSREAALGPGLMAEREALWASLGVASEAELADAIRSGDLDRTDGAVVQAVSRLAAGRLMVNQPDYRGADPGARP